MDRLSALDASFLYGETPETPMHVGAMVICEPPPEGVKPFETFREHIRERLHLLAFFQRKLGLSPIQLDHPVWVEELEPDFEYHIRHMALPKPGSDEQLIKLVTRLHMILLDRERPLWQFYVIEGLKGGRFALYLKMHHATIDGGASSAAIETIFSYEPQPAPVAPPPPRKKAAAPNIFELERTLRPHISTTPDPAYGLLRSVVIPHKDSAGRNFIIGADIHAYEVAALKRRAFLNFFLMGAASFLLARESTLAVTAINEEMDHRPAARPPSD